MNLKYTASYRLRILFILTAIAVFGTLFLLLQDMLTGCSIPAMTLVSQAKSGHSRFWISQPGKNKILCEDGICAEHVGNVAPESDGSKSQTGGGNPGNPPPGNPGNPPPGGPGNPPPGGPGNPPPGGPGNPPPNPPGNPPGNPPPNPPGNPPENPPPNPPPTNPDNHPPNNPDNHPPTQQEDPSLPITSPSPGVYNCHNAPCKFISQSQEDYQFINTYIYPLKQQKVGRGVVVEIGGNDGIMFSNSLFLEGVLGWKSILFEPSRKAYAAMKINRPKAINFNLAACLNHSRAEMIEDPEVTLVSAIEGETSEKFKAIWHPTEKDRYEVECGPIGYYLQIIGVKYIDLFSIDVEGAELVVLQSVDFKAIDVHYVLVEMDDHNKEKNEACRKYLTSFGFVSRGILGTWANELFENPNYQHLD